MITRDEYLFMVLRNDPMVLAMKAAHAMLQVAPEDLTATFDRYLAEVMNSKYTPDIASKILRTWMFSPFKFDPVVSEMPNFDRFHIYCGSYVHSIITGNQLCPCYTQEDYNDWLAVQKEL
jgi:hypothetical protein